MLATATTGGACKHSWMPGSRNLPGGEDAYRGATKSIPHGRGSTYTPGQGCLPRAWISTSHGGYLPWEVDVYHGAQTSPPWGGCCFWTWVKLVCDNKINFGAAPRSCCCLKNLWTLAAINLLHYMHWALLSLPLFYFTQINKGDLCQSGWFPS